MSTIATWKNFGGGKLANREVAICQSFLANIHRYTENVFGIYWLNVVYSPNFFLSKAVTCMVCQKNFPAKYFPCSYSLVFLLSSPIIPEFLLC